MSSSEEKIDKEEKSLIYDLRDALQVYECARRSGVDGRERAWALLDEACRAWMRFYESKQDVDSIDNLELSVHACNRLQNAGVRTISQLHGRDLSALGLAGKYQREVAEELSKWMARRG